MLKKILIAIKDFFEDLFGTILFILFDMLEIDLLFEVIGNIIYFILSLLHLIFVMPIEFVIKKLIRKKCLSVLNRRLVMSLLILSVDLLIILRYLLYIEKINERNKSYEKSNKWKKVRYRYGL